MAKIFQISHQTTTTQQFEKWQPHPSIMNCLQLIFQSFILCLQLRNDNMKIIS